ncbi:unnamed protein product [Zymoseptoria tritici ST99CH_1A5]|uniref:Methyltransferase domain-containing protein n=3 Tax=Zymoseptoria tritici TaxID=1047171 RepID=A0A1X7RUD6_ZYMT9|nr:unnamed protein product [Zymoseptoria tritici ST99CH_3D7]SMR52973.1 unnamed protein product [Zymoseptoria tritici ST99CH_1E4]SMR54475.1 unnamed protein product [Zymoseptoria tritici ST99CH_3D1]SMY24722.1 unnamed protein product [Zymoseptoria tritici ST99CH_1A5]
MSGTPQPENNALIAFSGRNYCAFGLQHGIHTVPVDERIERRYDELNDIFKQMVGTVIPPELRFDEIEDPEVLECGYQKGAWIDDLLKENDQSDILVTGVEIFTGHGNSDDDEEDEDNDEDSGIEEYHKVRFNLNAPFREEPGGFLTPERFNLVNSRLLVDGINAARWQFFVRDMKAVLRPGGWLQMMEVHPLWQSSSGHDLPFLHRWSERYMSMLTRMGKDPRIGSKLSLYMTECGFQNVHASIEQLPVGAWNPQRASVGNEFRTLSKDMVLAAGAWPLMRLSGMSQSDFDALIEGARAELDRQELKIYMSVHVVYGQRPPRR